MTAEEQARLVNTIVVHCANGHPHTQWSSRRDAPVPCPACGRVCQPLDQPKEP